MCGIAGFCGPADQFNDQKMRAMLTAIGHRGPDDSGYSSIPAGRGGHRAWLGNRRLAIQDLSPAGHQPMSGPDGNQIVFNGELYNFLELRRDLESLGHQFKSRCDTEVVLRSWSTHGLDAVKTWRGMFGVAVWTEADNELWLLRDQWGIKPLYYWWNGRSLLFCSEVRGLLATGMVPRRLCRRGVQDFLRFGSLQDPVTLVRDVYALLPGHALRWKNGHIETFAYPEAAPPPSPGVEDLEPMLREIVRQQLISDVPITVFLSGGVDSSVVGLLARQEGGSDVNTMSLVFEEPEYSERDYANRVAAHIGTRHHEVMLRADDCRVKAIEAIGKMDQPSVDGLNAYTICEAAAGLGFRVALSGLGGDEFFGGYSTFRRTAQIGRFQQLAASFPNLVNGTAALAGPYFAPRNKLTQRVSQLLQFSDFSDHPLLQQRTVFYPRQIGALGLLLDPAPEADHLADLRFHSLLADAARLDPYNQISLLEARLYMTNTLLRDSDQMSMAHSVELRVPLVDQVLGPALLTVPGAAKGFGRASKLWLREAFADKLPDEVFSRKKMGFTLPFHVWLRGPWASQVESTLFGDSRGLWEPQEIRSLWQRFQNGQLHWMLPWSLYVLRRWIAINIDQTPEEEGSPQASPHHTLAR